MGQQSTARGPDSAACFCKETFTGTEPRPSVYLRLWLSPCEDSSVQQPQKKTHGQRSWKYFLSGLLQKKCAGPRAKRKDFRSADVMSVSKQRLEILWPTCMRCHTHCSRLAASVSQPPCIATVRFTRLFPVIVWDPCTARKQPPSCQWLWSLNIMVFASRCTSFPAF